jgi:tetratricopeptide (TPR) repeat protein
MNRTLLFLILLGGLLAASGPEAWAASSSAVLQLEDGSKMTVEIIEEKPDSLTVRVPYGTFSIKRSRIVSITAQDQHQYHMAQGDAFSDRGQIQIAISEYAKALKLKPDDTLTRKKYFGSIGRQGLHLLSLKRTSAARAIFKRLLKLDPGNIDARLGIRRISQSEHSLKAMLLAADQYILRADNDRAILELSKALMAAPEKRLEICNRLAVAYRHRGENFYQAGKFSEAATDFAVTITLKPDLAGKIEGRYVSSVIPGVVAAVNTRNYKLAEKMLIPMLEFAPTDTRVMYLAGTLEANQGRLKEAAIFFARGLGKRHYGKATRERILALRAELKKAMGGGNRIVLDKPFEERYTESDPGDWKKLESSRFIVYHHNQKLAQLVARSAEYYVDRILENLSLNPDVLWAEKCPIYIYRDKKSYLAVTKQQQWSGGVSSVTHSKGQLVKQRISTFQTARKLLNNVLPHELAHLVFMSSISYSKKYPLALHEGVAIYNELAFRRSYYAGVLRTNLKMEATIPLEELLAMKTYPEKPDLFYAQSASLVEYLIKARSVGTFHVFSRDIEKTSLAAALKKHYGFGNMKEFTKAWLNSLNTQ